jgi:HEAT repeat protein
VDDMDGAQIIARLQDEDDDRRPAMQELAEEAPTAALVDALGAAERPLTRQLVADLLGFRGDAAALDALVAALDDPEVCVRASVADALGKVLMAEPPPAREAAHRAGAAMLARYEVEPSPAVYRTLASAVGPSGYRPAIPVLRAAAQSDDPSLVYTAKWGLHWLEGTPPPELPVRR